MAIRLRCDYPLNSIVTWEMKIQYKFMLEKSFVMHTIITWNVTKFISELLSRSGHPSNRSQKCHFTRIAPTLLCFAWAATARHCCSIQKTEKIRWSEQDSGNLCIFNQGKKMSYKPRDGAEWSQDNFLSSGLKGGHSYCSFVFSSACAKGLSPSPWRCKITIKEGHKDPALHKPHELWQIVQPPGT